MKAFGIFVLSLLVFLVLPVLANVYVNPYTKKDGTQVEGHYRSNPDGNPYNNWSTKGNRNPYTGKEGTRNSENNWQNNR